MIIVLLFLLFTVAGCESSSAPSPPIKQNSATDENTSQASVHGVFVSRDGRSKAVISGDRLVINGFLRNGDEFYFRGDFKQTGTNFNAIGAFGTVHGKKEFELRGSCYQDELVVDNDDMHFYKPN